MAGASIISVAGATDNPSWCNRNHNLCKVLPASMIWAGLSAGAENSTGVPRVWV